jgi:DNA-binding PadR family transcriptional regulator
MGSKSVPPESFRTVLFTADDASGRTLAPPWQPTGRPGPLQAPIPALALDVLIAIALGACHGRLIVDDISARHGPQAASVGQVYGMLRRLLEGGYVVETTRCASATANGQQTRCMAVTDRGRELAQAEVERLRAVVSAFERAGL